METVHKNPLRISSRSHGPILLLQVFALCLAGMLLFAVPLSTIFIDLEKALLWAISLCAMLVLLFPVFVRRDHDIFEPISFVMLYTILGVTIRVFYLLMYYRSYNISIAFLLRGQPPEFLLLSGLLIVIGLFFFVLGYSIRPTPYDVTQFAVIKKHFWDTKRLFLTIFFMELLSGIATYLFVQEMGIQILVLSDISSKHFQTIEGAEFARSSLGYYRWLASYTEVAFYLGVAWFATSNKRWISLSGLFVIILGLLASVFPFLNSSRSSVVFIIINAMVISHYLRKEIKVRLIGYAVATIVVILLLMTALRKDVGQFDAVVGYMTMENILIDLVGSGKFLDITKPAHIMAAIPTKLDYEYGATLMLWLLAPIPRSIWLSKPAIMVSTTIAQFVYGTMDSAGNGYSVPPGLIAELFWNLHILGVILGLFVMGIWLKFLYINFRKHLYSNKNAVLIYVMIMSPCVFVLQNSFSMFVLEALKAIIPLIIALHFIGRKSDPNSHPQSPKV